MKIHNKTAKFRSISTTPQFILNFQQKKCKIVILL